MTRQADRAKARTAVGAFIAAHSRIEHLLQRLQALCDDHFDCDPDALTWADVAGLQQVEAELREISDRVFHEGEFAA